MKPAQHITGGQFLVDALVANGVTQAFCVPGESYLPVLEALRTAPVKLITCRQESGAAMMAEAQGKLTGRPGICFVTRGPGATNASAGVHVAMQDSTPMILFIGQVERGFQDRDAFQEIDFTKFFAPVAKWAAEIRDAARIGEYVSRAFSIAMSGRPGPVVLSLPEDMLADQVIPRRIDPVKPTRQEMGEDTLQEFASLLAGAKNPLLLLGGSSWDEDGVRAAQAFAENWQLPVAVSFRRQHLFDHTHENFAGHVGIAADAALQQRIKDSDVLLMLGGRLSEMPSQSYALLDVPQPRQKLIHVHPDAQELGRVYQSALAICARAGSAAKRLQSLKPPAGVNWHGEAKKAKAAYQAFVAPKTNPGAVQLAELVMQMASLAGEDAIICNGAGNFAAWIHRFYPFRKFGTQLAPNSGSMGYGLPAAIGAKALFPERNVICFTGDGDVMMTVQELATAAQYDLGIVVIVIDNGMYGTIRMHQEKHFPGKPYGVDLANPDFAALAKSFGMKGFRVEITEDFAPAFKSALQSGKPSLIQVKIDPEAITPSKSLSEIRADAEQA